MYLVRWLGGEMAIWWEAKGSRGQEVERSRGREVLRSRGREVKRSWGQDGEMDTFRKNDVLVVLWLTGTSTFRKNDVLVVSCPQCKSGVICALRTLTWKIIFETPDSLRFFYNIIIPKILPILFIPDLFHNQICVICEICVKQRPCRPIKNQICEISEICERKSSPFTC